MSHYSLQTLMNHLSRFEKTPQTMPVLFVGHGNPMNAVTENDVTRNWQAIGQALPKPKAILSISAHWITPGKTQVLMAPKPETIHDFYGFPAVCSSSNTQATVRRLWLNGPSNWHPTQ